RLACADLHRQAGDIDAAMRQLTRIIAEDPQNPAALDGLVSVHGARDEWPLAVRYLRTLVARSDRPDLKAARLLQLGDMYATHLDDAGAADDAYLRASDLDPGNVDVMRRLVDVY